MHGEVTSWRNEARAEHTSRVRPKHEPAQHVDRETSSNAEAPAPLCRGAPMHRELRAGGTKHAQSNLFACGSKTRAGSTQEPADFKASIPQKHTKLDTCPIRRTPSNGSETEDPWSRLASGLSQNGNMHGSRHSPRCAPKALWSPTMSSMPKYFARNVSRSTVCGCTRSLMKNWFLAFRWGCDRAQHIPR